MISTRRTFLTRLTLGVGSLIVLPTAYRAWADGNHGLPVSTPEAEGVSSAGILAFLDAIAQSKHEFHGFVFARHGKVIAEGWWAPYARDLRHTLYSMSKSFTSTAIGLAIAEGRLTVEDKVVSFFPQDLPDPVPNNLAALRVRDLLTMSVGHDREPIMEIVKQENWLRAFLAWPFPNAPGTHFVYNSGATYTLSAIVQHLTGMTVLDYLKPRLFEPLGIEGATWETCPHGINTGGWGLSVPTGALAKFGQLYLQKGQWEGRAILPAKWVEEATTFKIQQPAPEKPSRPKEQNDWQQGYCYQFWRSQHNAFRGDGAFGQYTIVMPEQDAVIAINCETPDMQGEIDLVWQHLLPAMHDAPLPADADAQARLQQTLSALALALPKGQPTSLIADRIAGKTFQLEANDLGLQSVRFESIKDGIRFTARDAQNEHVIACGPGRWQDGETAFPGTPPRLVSGGAPKPGTPHPLAASGTWKNDQTFEMTWRYIETPHHDTVTCHFDGDKMEIAFMSSIAAMNSIPHDSRPTLHGKV
jgi:CubicO group peptidase (beta-lactamase class C family)